MIRIASSVQAHAARVRDDGDLQYMQGEGALPTLQRLRKSRRSLWWGLLNEYGKKVCITCNGTGHS